MTRARLDAEELDLIEEAMIDLGKNYGVYLSHKDDHKEKLTRISTAIAKINTIRQCSKIDAIDISSAHGG